MTKNNVPASANFAKLKAKLSELFELDKADLDFGIYRVLRARHKEIAEFLDKHLEKTVREALQSHNTVHQSHLNDDLRKAEQAARDAGFNPDQAPRVLEIREKLKAANDLDALADEVYSHLYTFFSRYYQEGDFLGLQRSTVHGREKYMIPYNGEEVKLVWANMDQYYIKSSELLRDYTFHVTPGAGTLLEGAEKERFTIHFKLVEADTEKDNRKSSGKTTRAFALDEEKPFDVSREDAEGAKDENEVLTIRFRYREHTAERNLQDKLNSDTEKTLADSLPARWKAVLLAPDPTYQGKDRKDTRTLLQKHLRAYTARHQFDYFIHKDLGGFLRRELDFYIKNEVMYLDDIEDASAPKAEEYLSKIRALRRCALPLIQMLEQLENFQKKLWLKKKFVVETRYCMTLDRVPESLYPEIAANAAQWEEWERLYALSEIFDSREDAKNAKESQKGLFRGFAPSRDPEFLKANPYLMIDTRHFGRDFTLKLLASVENLDETLDGVCFHSENFQALQLMQERYREQVKCVYIDPPYNTGEDDFPYKDNYQHSSWMCMMLHRAQLAREVLAEDGLFTVQIGDEEMASVRMIFDSCFSERKNSAVVRRGIKNVQAQFEDIDRLSLGHDIIHAYVKRTGVRLAHLKQALDEEKPGKWDTFWRGTDRPTMRYELFGQNPSTGQWRWEEGRAKRASRNYVYYLEHEAASKTLDEWYAENIQAGVDLDFVRLNEEGVVQYYVPPQNYRLLSDNWLDIPAAGNLTDFPHEKSLSLLHRVISWSTRPCDYVLDYFAGSGSTAHACISMQPNTESGRRYLVVEMGRYFDSILVPRLKRYSYSDNWKDGKPQNRNTGISHAFKIVRLEGYEDALNNLRLKRTPEQEAALKNAPEKARDHYLLGYFLDVESAGSASLLDLDQFRDPFAYQLKIATNSVGETVDTTVDLVETFNWLLGLKVKHIDAQKGFLTVTGEKRAGGRTLVIWRRLSDDPIADNQALEGFLAKIKVNPADTEFDYLYVNGSHTLTDPHNKVHLTEEAFQRLMFDVGSFESLE